LSVFDRRCSRYVLGSPESLASDVNNSHTPTIAATIKPGMTNN
jgi:hypothetical protein